MPLSNILETAPITLQKYPTQTNCIAFIARLQHLGRVSKVTTFVYAISLARNFLYGTPCLQVSTTPLTYYHNYRGLIVQ